MRRLLTLVAVIALGAAGAVALNSLFGPVGAKPIPSPGAQADSARFVLNFPLHPEKNGEFYFGQVVYCGVQTLSEPFSFDLVATAPPLLVDPEDFTSAYQTGHEASAWLDVKLQDSPGPAGQEAYRVPTADTVAFGLTLGGRPNKDQMVRVTSMPLGDESGGGMPFRGVATVLANAGASDPFVGDGRTDNYCVTIGVDGAPPPELEFPEAEFQEGEISTAMSVPDDWVLDGDGSDGGVLAGFPH